MFDVHLSRPNESANRPKLLDTERASFVSRLRSRSGERGNHRRAISFVYRSRIEAVIHQHDQDAVEFFFGVNLADALALLRFVENTASFDLEAMQNAILHPERVVAGLARLDELEIEKTGRLELRNFSRDAERLARERAILLRKLLCSGKYLHHFCVLVHECSFPESYVTSILGREETGAHLVIATVPLSANRNKRSN